MQSPLCEFKSFVNELENYLKKLAKKHNVEHLSGPQGHAVVYLYKNGNEETCARDIMEYLKVSKSVASNLLTRMEKNNFITIRSSDLDKRCKIIKLTELGIEKAKLMTNFFDEISNELLKEISCEETQIALKVVKQINKNLKKDK
ncbi:MarR family transcriptional regulator [Actinomyces sp. zg-332]|uniref:MarR family winged helix-turn-helix transcriptional regulator n=1 Tax=Actinomyces sp. zg-332 TaxID=2708340 RepID=UPI001421A2A5|nr:MarR family transcriptional regulator [Actinomyces sp. zg-332]QPK94673.1 MarR family transcriptional regulator [Actinomyces sp. zg-332]